MVPPAHNLSPCRCFQEHTHTPVPMERGHASGAMLLEGMIEELSVFRRALREEDKTAKEWGKMKLLAPAISDYFLLF